jgi:hypothetical protein
MDHLLTIEELKNAFVNNTPIIFTKQYEEYMVKKSGQVSKIDTSIDGFDYIIYIEIEPKIFYKVIFSGAKFYIK